MRGFRSIVPAIGFVFAVVLVFIGRMRHEPHHAAPLAERRALPVRMPATRPVKVVTAPPVPLDRAVDGSATVQINEIGAANRSTALDETGDTPDWIELHNASTRAVDLAGATLALASAADAEPWRLPAIVLAPDEYRLVWASGEDRREIPAREIVSASDLPFVQSLIRIGEVWRYMVGNASRRNVPPDWKTLEFDDRRWALGASGFGYDDGDDATIVPAGTTTVFIRRQFEIEDPKRLGQIVLRIDYDDGFVAYLNGVRVAGANASAEHPLPGAMATSKREAGRPEFYDLSPHADLLRAGRNVLAIVGLNDSPSSDMSLLPEIGVLAFVCHTDFELPSEGGELVLRDANGNVVDRVRYPELADDRSWGRARNEGAAANAGDGEERASGAWGYFVTPTPSAANRTPLHNYLPAGALRFEPLPGPLRQGSQIRAVLEGGSQGVTIGLSTDGQPPRAPRGHHIGAVTFDRDLLLRAATFVGDERFSPVVAATYFREAPRHLPVLAVSMDPAEFRRIHLGVQNHGREYESSAYLEIFEPGGTRVAATGVGFRLHGGYGRRGGYSTKKSYRLYFRRFYGDPFLDYPLISDVPGGAVRRIVLRANFNDRLGAYHAGASFIRDQVLRDLHRDLGAPVAAGTWCTLYVNLEFRGIYNAVERLDKRFLVRRFGGEEWDMVNTGDEVVCGTRDAWDALGDLVRGRTHGRPPTLEELEREVDLENFTAYVILNLWSQNQDWPHNNWYAARRRSNSSEAASADGEVAGEETPSRWIFLSWDAEWGMGLEPSGWRADSFRFIAGKKGLIRDLFAALWRHEAYRHRFQNAVDAALAGPLSAENAEAIVNRHATILRPVIEAELRAHARRASVGQWERNVQVVRDFARQRGPWFRRAVSEAARAPLPGGGGDR